MAGYRARSRSRSWRRRARWRPPRSIDGMSGFIGDAGSAPKAVSRAGPTCLRRAMRPRGRRRGRPGRRRSRHTFR
ncbi:hypothetical protein GSH03_17755 [Burkholderia pseudomallei]|nr:hypothetical protein [Burkholderia pseudomallei]